MANATKTRIIDLSKGFATDLSPQEREISYLARAENVLFEVSRAVHKVGGGTRLNGTALTAAPSILGQFDYWRSGTSGSFAQRYVVTTSDSKVYQEDPATPGAFNNITGAASIGANAIPSFVQARDTLGILWSDASTPLTWAQTGNVATWTQAPAGRCGCFHKGRVWISGTNANPSRVAYSSYTSITDFTGADTGAIESAFNPDDGDRVVGLASYKGALIVFKGPNMGSIYVVYGSSPEGEDGFRVEPLVKGIPLQSPNSIVAVGDDLFFMSNRAIESLAAVAAHGDFEEDDLTKYLKGFFRDSVAQTQLTKVWGQNYAQKGIVLWTLPKAGSTTPDMILGLSYIRPDEGLKPFTWTLSSCASLGIRIHPTTKVRELIIGNTAGFLIRMEQSGRSMPSNTAYSARITTPSIIVGDADSVGQPRVDQVVTLNRLWLRTQAVGDYDVTVNVTRDDQPAETYFFNQGNAGGIFDTSLWDIAVFGSTNVIISAQDLVGEARAVSLDILQGGLNEDMHLLECGIEYTPTAAHQALNNP